LLRQLEDQYQHEDSDLAPYAIHNSASKGRRFPEEVHPFRTDFQRDRDRILHSRAFRRLEYKTQVFLNGEGDHLRTRLTHTIEVAAITRTIARALYLNEDLAETIALAHDLGHTPFGHPGESALNELLKEFGGFDHNDQALRVVDELEQKYPDYDGLNLTWEVREGLVKHRSEGRIIDIDGVPLSPSPFLESQVADLADDLTYYGHDVDDGLEAGLIDEEMLSEIEIWNMASQKAAERGMKIVPGEDKSRAYTVRCLIDMMVGNAILNSEKQIKESKLDNPEKAQLMIEKVVSFDDDFHRMTQQLRTFLYKNVYHHHDVAVVNDNAVEKMRKLFLAFVKKPELMGSTAQERIKKDGLYLAIADNIAGMTDRFALLEYDKLIAR
jgi:dGTPase